MQFLVRIIFVIILLFCSKSFAQNFQPNPQNSYDCKVTNALIDAIIEELQNNNPNVVKNLPLCYRLDRALILKVSLIDSSQFQYAAENLKQDELFVKRLLKVDPTVLKYASKNLRLDKAFMERATYLNRDALQYGDSNLLDNKLFMKKMIDIDSRNYIFSSNRLKEIPEFAAEAFEDNGLLLEYAPDSVKSNKNLVTIAIKSNNKAFEFSSQELQKDPTLIKLSKKESSIKSFESLGNFLNENYIANLETKNLGSKISNKAKFFSETKIIDRNYITKWHKINNFKNEETDNDLQLISADSRNYPISWKEDFKDYPDLIKKIEKFFLEHYIDQNTIDKLSTTFLWKIKSDPETLAFNIYLLRNSRDIDLGPEFSDITSLTAIVQKQDNKWNMTVIEVIFSSELKVDVSYINGHKKYILWDLYKLNENDQNPKIIFKVEDRFNEYFQVFEEQRNGKYEMIYQFEPFSNVEKKD